MRNEVCCPSLQTNHTSCEEILLKTQCTFFGTLRCPAAGAGWMLVVVVAVVVVGLGRVGAGLGEAGVVLVLGWRDDVLCLALQPHL